MDQRPESPIPSRLPTPELSGVNVQVTNAADALRRVVDTYGFDITCAAWNWISMENEVMPMLDVGTFPDQILLTPQMASSEPAQHYDPTVPTPLQMTPTMGMHEMPLHRSFTPFELVPSAEYLPSQTQVHVSAIEFQFHVPPDDDAEGREDADSEEMCILRL